MDRCSSKMLLNNANTKQTEARSRLLDLILESDSPVTAYDLHKFISGEQQVDLATVYRALKLFTVKGLIRTVNINGDTVYYEKACEHNPLHAHFYCESCGAVECLTPFGFDESSSFIKMAKGKDIRNIELVMKGRCEKCV